MTIDTIDATGFGAARATASCDDSILRGPWTAYLADRDGFVYLSVANAIEDLGDTEEVRIGVARGTAAPVERHGNLRLSGTNLSGDRVFEIETYIDGEGDDSQSAVARYAQAQAMAAGLNAAGLHEPAPGYSCVNENCGCRKVATV